MPSETLPTDFLRDTIGQQAQKGRATLRAGVNYGDYMVDSDERGTVQFPGRIFARTNEGKVIEVGGLEDLPMGAEILLTNKDGQPISYGTMGDDGSVALYGDKPSIGDDVGSQISRMTAEIPRALATTFGLAAGALGKEEMAKSALEFSKQAGKSIEEDQYRDNPAGVMADKTDSRSGARTMLNLAAGSTPFLATFGAATKMGQMVGKTLGAAFLRKPEVIKQFGSVGGLLAAMKTNAALNAGFVANDIQQALEELGVPPEQQRQAMQDGAIMPGVVSALTAVAAANNFLGRGGLHKQGFVEGGTEVIEEISQAEALKQHGHEPYNFTDVALQSFGAGYLSQMGIGAVGEALRPIAKYPQLLRLRRQMGKAQNFAQSIGGLKLGEQYTADKEFFKTLKELNKWSGRLKEVRGMSHEGLRANFAKHFPGFDGQEEDMRTAVQEAAKAFNEAIERYGRPLDGIGNAAKILALAESDDMGSDEAKLFLDKAAQTLGASPAATMEDKANLVSNFMGNVDTVWRDWRVTEAYRTAFGDILPRKPMHTEDAAEMIREADIEKVLERAERFSMEYQKMMGKQNIVQDTVGKNFLNMLNKKPLAALIGMGLVDNEKASQKIQADPGFAKKVAQSENNSAVSQAYDRLEKKGRVRPQTLRMNLQRAAAQDEKETAAQAKANEGAEKPKPVVPSTANREKAYADAMKEFIKDIEERAKAATDILQWVRVMFPDDAFADVAANIRFHSRNKGKAEPDDASEVMAILAQGISQGFIDMPYGDALPDQIEQTLAELVEVLQAQKAKEEAEAQAAAAAPPPAPTPAPAPPPPPTPPESEGESKGESEEEGKPAEETGEETETEEKTETEEDKPEDKPKEEAKQEEELEEASAEPEKVAAADASILSLYEGGKIDDEALSNLREVMGGWTMVDPEGKPLLELKAAALWLAYLSGGGNDVSTDGNAAYKRFVKTLQDNLSTGIPANFDHKQLISQMAKGGLLEAYKDEDGKKMYGYPLNEDKDGMAERASDWDAVRDRFFQEKEDDEDSEDGGGEGGGENIRGLQRTWKEAARGIDRAKRKIAAFTAKIQDGINRGGNGIAPTTMNNAAKPKPIDCV